MLFVFSNRLQLSLFCLKSLCNLFFFFYFNRNVYLFSRDSKSNDITWQNVGPDSEFQFLPQWYIDEFKK